MTPNEILGIGMLEYIRNKLHLTAYNNRCRNNSDPVNFVPRLSQVGLQRVSTSLKPSFAF